MKKKLIVTILCIVLAVPSGCGNSSNNTPDVLKSKIEKSSSSSDNEPYTSDELLAFDLTADDFKNDIITVLQPFGYSLSVDDVNTSSTCSFGLNSPDNTVTYIHLLLDSDNYISNVDIKQNGSDSFLDVAFATIVVTNPASDFHSIMDSLNLKNYATSNVENSKIESVDGITYMFSCGTLSIQRDSDNKDLYVKQPLSIFISANPDTYDDSVPNNIQTEDVDTGYANMLLEYSNLFLVQLSVFSDSTLIESVQNGTDIQSLSSDISDTLEKISTAESVLQGYYDAFDSNRTEAPYGTKIMTLLSYSQSALRQYAICVEHLQDYLYTPDQKYLEDATEYYQKASLSLLDFTELLNSELTELGLK